MNDRETTKGVGMENDIWCTSKQVREYLNISEPTLAQYIWEQRFPSYSKSDFEWRKPKPPVPSSLKNAVQVGPKGWTFIDDFTKQMKADDYSWSFKNILKNLDDFIFHPKDVLEFKEKHSSKGTELPQKDTEKLFELPNFSMKNDSEIKINLQNKTKTLTPKEMGCRDERTSEWKMLCQIIKDPEHKMDMGRAGNTGATRKSYEARRKLLERIERKLVKVLHEKLNIDLPKDFELFERNSSDPPGVRRLKIGSPGSGVKLNFEKMSDEKILLKFYSLPSSDKNFNAWVQELKRRDIPAEKIMRHVSLDDILQDFKKPEYEGFSQEAYDKERLKEAYDSEEG